MNTIVALALGLTFLTAPRSHGADQKPVVGLAAWYGEKYRGKLMANGERFDPEAFTASCWYYPLGTRVRVSCYPAGNQAPRAVVATVTDRGPVQRLRDQGRVIDLSLAAFRALASPKVGIIRVTVEPEGALPPSVQLAAHQPTRQFTRPPRDITQKSGFVR